MNFRPSRPNVLAAVSRPEDISNNALLDFVLAHVQGDERPYLTVSLFGVKFLGLLDTGASRTILGSAGWQRLSRLGIETRGRAMTVKLADGSTCVSPGTITAVVKLRDVEKVLNILVVPDVTTELILGTDFWRTMGIVPDLRRGDWCFTDCPEVQLGALLEDTLDGEQRAQLENLVSRLFSNVDPERIGCTNLVEHVIVTRSPAIKQRYYPISPAMQRVVNSELDKMLAQGIVERSNSPWSSPILLVPKRDGSHRFCVDFRKLNSVTERDAYPLPYVSHILDKLRDARYLSTLDIKSAYWEIPMAENSKQYTAFTVPNRGLFQFRRMPFGLHNAPATWQRFIDRVIGADLEPHVFAYLDDIIIVTPTFEQHLVVLEEVVKRIHSAGLTLSREKSQFCRSELRYLGYVINGSGLLVDPEKIRAMLNIPTPKSTSEVRRILGISSWYRRFVKDYATLVAPLTNLLRKNKRFEWSEECERAWVSVKECLVTAPVLAMPDYEREFVIQADASNFGIGAVLTQNFDDGERVIAYLSRSLSRQERNFSTTEKECLAVLYAIEKFRPYIEGSHFTVITDHFSLLWLNSLQNPSGRLARWAVRLQQYDFTIVHRKGKDHIVPDALSRSVPVIETAQPDIPILDKWYLRLVENIRIRPEKFPTFRLIDGVPYKHIPSHYPDLADDHSQWKRVVPKELRKTIIKQNHDAPTAGHLGIFKTTSRVLEKAYWPGMKSDIAKYIRSCGACMRAKPLQQAPTGKMGGHSLISRPWQVISADVVGPLPRTSHGNQFIFVVTDCFSKLSLFFPLRRATASAIVRYLENDVFLQYGVPQALITDNGVQFRSKEMRKLLATYSVKPSFVSYYRPQANPTERVNRVLKTMLISYVSSNHRKWDTVLPKLACAVRTAKHEVTGLTPYFINFGREMLLSGKDHMVELKDGEPLSVDDPKRDIYKHRSEALSRVFKDVQARLQQAYIKAKSRYDLRRRTVQFWPDQLVWRRNFVLSDASKFFSAKLADKFVGPFMVHRRIGRDSYELKDLEQRILPGTWHSSHLKAQPSEED